MCCSRHRRLRNPASKTSRADLVVLSRKSFETFQQHTRRIHPERSLITPHLPNQPGISHDENFGGYLEQLWQTIHDRSQRRMPQTLNDVRHERDRERSSEGEQRKGEGWRKTRREGKARELGRMERSEEDEGEVLSCSPDREQRPWVDNTLDQR